MSSFLALLDDISVLAKAAASSVDDIVAGSGKAASKTAAVLIDDTAVSPQYFQGVTPARELPVVLKIAKGSLVNKAVIILAIMLLSAVAPWIFPWALVLGGGYLVFEGAEKLVHRIKGEAGDAERAAGRSPQDERSIVRSAITTDFVLSIEIMLISLSNLEASIWWMRLVMLVLVGAMMTALVYGAVALLIKLDDIGRWTAKQGVDRGIGVLRSLGVGLVKLMPRLFQVLTVVGTAAMLWVGGHLLIVNLAEVGLPLFRELSHGITHAITNGVLLWCADALISAVFGAVVGFVIVGATLIKDIGRRSKVAKAR